MCIRDRGHIELAAPVSHIWYFKGIPSRMGLILDISPRLLEQVLYFASYIVVEPGRTPLQKKQILSEKDYRDMREKYEDEFDAGMGAEYIKKLLAEIDLEGLSASLKEELESATGQKRARLLKRLEVVESFRLSGNRPEWMILDVVPVIPPDIRPMVQHLSLIHIYRWPPNCALPPRGCWVTRESGPVERAWILSSTRWWSLRKYIYQTVTGLSLIHISRRLS